jgi:hypothetical protein
LLFLQPFYIFFAAFLHKFTLNDFYNLILSMAYFKNFLVLCLAFFAVEATAQISWNTSGTGSVTSNVCLGSAFIDVEFNNLTGGVLPNDTLRIQLPQGVFFDASSINEVSAFNVRTHDISNLNAPILVLDDLPAVGGTVRFSFKITSTCLALAHQQSGGTFNIAYTLSSGATVFAVHTSPAFNLSAAAIDFIAVTPTNYTGALGSSYPQTVTVQNGGNSGTRTFFLALNPTAGLIYSAPTLGTLNATSDTIFFSGTDLGADELFTPSEQITLNYTVTVQACVDLLTNLVVGWGCDAANCANTSATSISANVPQLFPNLLTSVVTRQPIRCFGALDTQVVRVVNTGAGVARGIVFDIGSGNPAFNGTLNSNFNNVDTSTIAIRIGSGGVYTHVSPSAIQTQNVPTMGGIRIPRVTINLPNMNPNDTVFISWATITPCPNISCNSGVSFESWSYRVNYEDNCEINNYSTNWLLGSASGYRYISTYGSSGAAPSNLSGGAVGVFRLTIGELGYSLSTAPTTGYMELRFRLPAGLAFDNVAGDVVLQNKFLACPWAAASIAMVGDTVVARYNLNTRPGCFTNNFELHLRLRGDCSQPYVNPLVLTAQMRYNFYPACATGCEIRTYCTTFSPVTLQCPTTCADGGIFTTDFWAQRANFGAPDNNNDGNADGAGSLNMAAVRYNTIIVGDTLQTTLRGLVVTSALNPQFEFVSAVSTFDMAGAFANDLSTLGAEVTVYDVSTGTVYTNNAPIAIVTPNTVFRVDVNAVVPVGFVFESDDSIVIRSQFRLNENTSSAYVNHTITNSFYASRVASPTPAQRFACNNFDGIFETLGYYYTVCCGDGFQTTGCGATTLNQNLYLSVGPCCGNYAGGNYFRNEIRQFSIPDTMEVILPAGYIYNTAVGANITYVRTGQTYPQINLSPIDPNASVLKFPLRNLFVPYGGTYAVSDEGWYAVFNVSVVPTCAAPTVATNVPNVRYVGDFITTSAPEFNHLNWATTSDIVYNNAPDLDPIPVTTLIDANDTLVWEVRVENTVNVAAANNSFLAFRSRRGTIQVFDVVDLTTNTSLSQTNGIYQLGTRPASSSRSYSISATQTSCVLDTLVVYTGWDCEGYPLNISDYPCQLDSTLLYFKDPSTELQLLVVSPVDSADMCGLLTYEIELTSAKASPISNLFAEMSLPIGLNLVPNSVAFDYPLGTGFVPVADPTLLAGDYHFDISNYSAALASLPGLLDAATIDERKVRVRFQVTTDCNFISGDAFAVRAGATSVCGSALPTLNYDVPPISIRGSVTTPYVTQVTATTDPITACGEDHPYFYNVRVINLGPSATRNVDNLVVRLPAGIYMQSYDPLAAGQHNAPALQPTITVVAGATELRWDMPNAIIAGDSIKFSIRLEAATDPALCAAPLSSTLFTTINSSVLCVSSATLCNSQSANGTGLAFITVQRPSLTVDVAGSTGGNEYNGITGINYIALPTNIANAIQNTTTGDTLVVDYYCDLDNSNTYTGADNYIGSYAYSGGLTAGGNHNFIWRDTFAAAVCDVNGGQNIIAVLQDTTDLNSIVQCACQYSQRPATDILLPVDFAHFDANAHDCKVNLSWTTRNELDNHYFEIQRSRDGVYFEPIGRVTSQGNTATAQNYEFVDLQPAEGNNYYRLKAISHANMSRLTSIAVAQNHCTSPEISVYPIPAADDVFLQITAQSQQTKINVIDALGQVVHTQIAQLHDGSNQIRIDIKLLPSGAYLLQCQHQRGTATSTFIKE